MELEAQGSDVPGAHTSIDNPRGMCGRPAASGRGRCVWGKGRKVGDARSAPSPLLPPPPPPPALPYSRVLPPTTLSPLSELLAYGLSPPAPPGAVSSHVRPPARSLSCSWVFAQRCSSPVKQNSARTRAVVTLTLLPARMLPGALSASEGGLGAVGSVGGAVSEFMTKRSR